MADANTPAAAPIGSFINNAGERVIWYPTDRPFAFKVTVDEQPLTLERLLRRYDGKQSVAK